MAKDIFRRLSAGRPPEKSVKQPRKGANLVAQWEQEAGIHAFLRDILAKRPVPTTTIQKRGAARGFTKKQLWRAKGLIGISSFKKRTEFDGRWFWTLPQNAPAINPRSRFARRLRNLSKSLGYKLHPIGKPTKWGRPRKNSEQKQPARDREDSLKSG